MHKLKNGNNNTKSLIFMFIDSLSYSLIPVLAALSNSNISGIPYLSYSLFMAVATYFIYIRFKRYKTLELINYKVVLLSSVAGVTFAAAQFFLILAIDKAGNAYFPTVVFQVYPIFIIFFMVIFKMSEEAISLKKIPVMMMAMLGILFLYSDANLTEIASLYAILLPIVSAALISFSVVMVVKLTKELEKLGSSPESSPIISNFFSRLISAVVAVPTLLWFLNKNDFSFQLSIDSLPIIIVYGVFCLSIGSIFYYRALRLTSNSLSIHMVSYLSIVMAILWLWMLQIDQISGIILIGAAFVLVSNILLNFNLEQKYAYNGSIIWMLLAGTLIYFISGKGIGSYYEAVLSPLFFFAITLAFLTDRLTKNREVEESKVLTIISNLVEENPNNLHSLISKITAISESNSPSAIISAYSVICFDELGKENRFLLNEFVLSRVKDVRYSEFIVLALTALLAIIIAIFYRPFGYIYDVFALILTTAIVFNFLSVFDKKKERSNSFIKLNLHDNKLYPIVTFDEGRSFTQVEIVVSSFLLTVVLIIFLIVFLFKHGVW